VVCAFAALPANSRILDYCVSSMRRSYASVSVHAAVSAVDLAVGAVSRQAVEVCGAAGSGGRDVRA